MVSKKLETEFTNLKKEFVGLQDLIKNLLNKHENLDKKYEKFIQKQKKNNFKCKKCGDKFELLKNLQDHKEEGCSNDNYQCTECEKYFKDEDKLQKHTEKLHVKFECDECAKFLDLKQFLKDTKKLLMKMSSCFVTTSTMIRIALMMRNVFMSMKTPTIASLGIIVKEICACIGMRSQLGKSVMMIIPLIKVMMMMIPLVIMRV